MNPPEKTQPPFIFVNGMTRVEPAKRKLIRRYVMMGKNRGKTRQVKPKAPNSRASDGAEDQDRSSGLLVKMIYSRIPNKVGSELSFTQFAAPVDPPLLHDLLKFSFMAKRIMYPLESCIIFHRQTKVDTSWFDYLTHDAVYMHVAVFACQAYISSSSLQKGSTLPLQAIEHYSAALGLLQERLSNAKKKDKISDPTILAVLSLALHSHFMSDYDTLKHHMKGLYRIIDMRGGLAAFNNNTKMIMELLKCDLGVALNNGTDPEFLRDPYLESLLIYDLASLPAKKSEPFANDLPWEPSQMGITEDLIQAWVFLNRFCSTMNSAAELKRQLPKEILLNAMVSTMYRLLRMKYFKSNSVNEAVRLGLLVFSSHIFLTWQNIKLPNTYLSNAYRGYLVNLKQPSMLPSIFLLWLLMVGSLSIFSAAEDTWLIPWIQVNINLCEAHTWDEFRRQLKALLWIDILHDKPGREIFDIAMSTGTEFNGKGLPRLVVAS